MTLKDIFMKLFYHKKKKEAKLKEPKKMGDNEKSARLLVNTLDRLAIRYKPFLDMCPSESAFRELESLLIQNVELILLNKHEKAIMALVEEGKARPVEIGFLIEGKKS